MYYDLNLKFKDEAEANAMLFVEQSYTEDGEIKTYKVHKYAAIDIIGPIYKATGKVFKNEDGDAPEMAPVEGWHVNVRGEICPELEAYALNLDTPRRVWY
jgi:hypothetical protein